MALRLNGSTSGYVEIDAPAVAGSNTLTLPDGNGTSGQYLQTNGSGALSWQTVTAGSILQVVQTVKSDTDSTSSTTFTDITGFNATITPSSASSKILVQVVIGTFSNNTSGRGSNYQLVRGSTPIALGDNGDAGQTSFSFWTGDTSYMGGGQQFTYLDSPATTSATTYKVQWMTYSNTVYLNRSSSSSTQSWCRRGSSQIILMEVAG